MKTKHKILKSDLIESEFFKDDIDMSFLYDYIDLSHKEDPMIKILSDEVNLKGDKCSRICMIDPTDDTLHLGMAKSEAMPYTQFEDMRGVDAIFDYCKSNKFQYGETYFPDVPVAEDGFPPNQYFRPSDGYMLEIVFAEMGFRLLNVSVGCYKELSDNYPIYSTEELIGIEKKTDEGFYFTPYKDELLDLNVMAMEFNPFHPMSIKLIKTLEWRGNVLSGTYQYRKKIVPFKRDLEDKRYRIFSEDWRQVLPQSIRMSGIMEIFDLVASFPINDIIKLKKRNYPIEPFVVEPLIINSDDIEYPYSKLGPKLISVSRGVGKVISVPYSLMEIPWENKESCYSEITSYCSLFADDYLEYKRKIGKQIVARRIEFGPNGLEADDVFIRVSKRDNGVFFRAFEKHEKGKYHFYEMEQMKFLSFPSNRWGSIVYPYNCQTLVDIVRDDGNVHEFLPMYVTVDDSYDFHFEDEEMSFLEEKIQVDVDHLEKVSSLYSQGDSGQLSREYNQYCFICHNIVSDGTVYDRNGVRSWIHNECFRCPCGNERDTYYSMKEKCFLCKDGSQCIYQRLCVVCSKYCRNDEIHETFYVHRGCIECQCGKYFQVKRYLDKYCCQCSRGKQYKLLYIRSKDKRMINNKV